MRASAFIGRVSGLAFALGIGATVGGFGLGIAAASPTDSSAGADSARSGSSDSSGAERPRETRSTQDTTSEPAAVSNRARSSGKTPVEPPDTAPAAVQSDIALSPSPTTTAPKLASATAATVRMPAPAEAARLTTTFEVASPNATNPEHSEALESEPYALTSAQPVALIGMAESAVSSVPGSDPSGPAALPLAWTVLAAARRERGIHTTVRRTTAVALSSGDSQGTGVVLAAAASDIADETPRAVNPVSAEVAVNPITAIIEPIQNLIRIATTIVQFVATQVVQTVVQAVMSIVNFFVPGTTGTIVNTITLNEPAEPPWPQLLVVSPDSKRLYVPLTQYAGVAVIDIDPISPAVNTVTSTIGADNGIWSFADAAITPDGKKLLLVNSNDDSVLTLSASAGSQAAYTSISLRSPRAVAVSTDGARAYVTYSGRETGVAVIDTATNTVVATVPVFGYQPDAIAVNPAGTRVYVITLSGIGAKVSVIDTRTLSTLAVVGVGYDPIDLVASPDGKRVYVTNLNSGVSVIDTTTNTVVSTINSRAPESVAISPNGKKLFVANWVTTNSDYVSTYSISVIDTATQLVTANVSIDGQVEDMIVSPDGERLYVTVTGSSIGTTGFPAKILAIDI